MNVKINNIDTVSLTDKNFITEGGEGKIFGIKDKIYKVYSEHIIPKEKVKELQILDRPNIIVPIDLLYSENNKFIGFTMQWIKNTVPLVKFFTNSFQQDNNIKIENLTNLIKKLQENIHYIHSKKIIIVDGNEFNYLIDSKFKDVYFIDVDSYQTPHFPATAIMPSIKDHHTPKFNENSDWFSFAVIAFQMYTGIHPYKGRHPSFDKKDFESRMKKNVSVFNKNVTIPSQARDFKLIPEAYKNWFIDVFEKGKRIPPPEEIGKIISQVLIKSDSIGASKFNLDLFETFKDAIFDYNFVESNEIITSINEHKINNKFYKKSEIRTSKILILNNKFIEVFIKDETVRFKILNDKSYKIQDINLNAKRFFIFDNNLYLVQENKIIHISFITNESNKTIFIGLDKYLDILPNSSVTYQGFIYQNMLGKPYFVIPYNINKITNLGIINIKELENCKIINTKKDNNCFIFVVFKDNEYRKILIKFDEKYQKYDVSIFNDTTLEAELITFPEKGIGVFTDDEKFYIFSLKSNLDKFNIIEDQKMFKFNFKLFKNTKNIVYQHSNKLYNLSVKS
jgi:hypothetical protein